MSPTEVPFHCVVEKSVVDGVRTAAVKCHGRLVGKTAGEMRDTVKALIVDGGAIVMDLSDVNYMDSLGLGVLVGLKVSAINDGYCTLTFSNLTPRIRDLLRLTNLTSLFAS